MSNENIDSFANMQRQLADFNAAQPRVRTQGEAALGRLLPIAQRGTGQSKIVANFLLSLYNGYRFKFDLTDFRALDIAIFEDCMLVLRMDFCPLQEVHNYFENGGKVFEQMAAYYGITGYEKLTAKEAT